MIAHYKITVKKEHQTSKTLKWIKIDKNGIGEIYCDRNDLVDKNYNVVGYAFSEVIEYGDGGDGDGFGLNQMSGVL